METKKKNKKKLKRKYKVYIFNGIIILLIVIFLVSTYKFLSIMYYDKKNIKENEKLVEEVVKPIEVEEEVESEEEKEEDNPLNYKIDFKTLKERNIDIVGWIMIPNTNINYPIVKGIDNTYYLTRNIDKEYNRSGMIYMNYKNREDFSDNNTVLFGHNSYNATMFGELKKIYSKELGEEVKIYIYTEKKVAVYNVYATYIASPNDTNPLDQTIKKFSKSDKNYVYKDTNLETLTLSTCHTDRTKRLIIHAMKQNEIFYEN